MCDVKYFVMHKSEIHVWLIITDELRIMEAILVAASITHLSDVWPSGRVALWVT